MNETELQFRTAAFGGFQKQDVLTYLETSAREQAEKLSALQRELEEAKKGKAEAEEKASAEEKRLSNLEEENKRLAADLADREASLSKLSAERADLAAQVAGLTQEVKKLTPAAASYEAIKDRTAGIELEAHGRAQAIEQEAQAKVKKTKAEMECWFGKLQSAYSRLRADLDATITHASGELDRVNQSLEGISREFNAHDAALKALQETVETLSGPKAPQPLPLEEK